MATVTFDQQIFPTKYQIEFKGNRYYLAGKMTKRVTSILKKFPDDKEGLLDWARRCVALTAGRMLHDRVMVHPKTGKRVVYFSEEEISGLAEQAYRNPDAIKEETADTGTAVHAFIDEWLQGGATEEKYQEICAAYLLPTETMNTLELIQKQTKTKDMSDADRNLFYDQMKGYMFRKFVDFWKASGLIFVTSEMLIGSLEYGFCGRLDVLAKDAWGRLFLLDFKTSKWVSPSYFSQVAAYKLAFEEMTGLKIHKCAIVQCPREWTDYNLGFGVYPVETARYKKIFLNILKFWNETEFEAAKCRLDHLPVMRAARRTPAADAYAIP